MLTFFWRLRRYLACVLFLCLPVAAFAGVIRGTVRDTTGATIQGATILLGLNGTYIRQTRSASDGTFQFVTGHSGRFTLVIQAHTFRQLNVPAFYAGQSDSVERTLILEPECVHESMVVSATGTPTPQDETSEPTSVLTPTDIDRQEDFVDALRIEPGVSVVQTGQRGAQTSLFLRGGDSDASLTLLDGIPIDEIGGIFDYGNMANTGIQSVETYRGPDSNLYGADAASGVVQFHTPEGFTSSPTVTFRGDVGNFHTARNELDLAGSHNRLDYYGAYSWLQTANALPMDQYHEGAAAGNLGWQPTANLALRGTAHYIVSAVGVPNAWNFYFIPDDRKQSDQNLYVTGSLEYQLTPDFHNRVEYGATRKREQSQQWYPAGICEPVNSCNLAYPNAGNFYGEDVTIRGANGYQVVGQALLDYSTGNGSVYPNRLDLVSNRDQVQYQGDYHFTPHITGLVGFHYENERGDEREPVYALNDQVERNNYDYLAELTGDFHSRFFYTLGGSLERYQLFGTQVTPRFGLSYYLIRPRHGVFNGTRVNFDFAEGVREPTVADQAGSLYTFLLANGGAATIQSLHIPQLEAPTSRTWQGGLEQAMLGERMIVHLNLFHNEFGRQIESVGVGLIPQLLPGLTTAQQQQLESTLNNDGAFSLTVNSEAFRAMGLEFTVDGGVGHGFRYKAGYTYLDAVVQRSFSSDNQALLGGYEPTLNGIPIGIYSPLDGARPFRRPPNSGYFSASYAGTRWTVLGTGAFASRSDDSTFLGYMDINQGNSLLLPNRNLDFGYANIDFGGSFQLFQHIAIYGQAENLLSDQHMAPIGYPSLPFNFRLGLRIAVGKQSATPLK